MSMLKMKSVLLLTMAIFRSRLLGYSTPFLKAKFSDVCLVDVGGLEHEKAGRGLVHQGPEVFRHMVLGKAEVKRHVVVNGLEAQIVVEQSSDGVEGSRRRR